MTGWGGASTPTQNNVSAYTDFPRTTAAYYTSGTFAQSQVGAVTPGQTYTISIYLRTDSFSVSGNIYALFNLSGGGTSFPSTTYTASAQTVTRISWTATAPANAVSLAVLLDGINFGSNPANLTAVLIEPVGSLDTYFDGDSPSASWDGAPGDSSSTLASVITGGATPTTTSAITATAVNNAVGAATGTTTSSITATGVNAAAGKATATTTASVTATGANAAVGAATETTTAAITATASNAAAGAASAVSTGVSIIAAAVAGQVASLSTGVQIIATAEVTGRPQGSWWQLDSILREAWQEAEYYASQPPVACPSCGEPLRQGPSVTPGILYCPWGHFRYPRDWDPDTMAGL